MKLCYLASPYSHDDKTTRTYRAITACKAWKWLQEQGYKVFSPVAHTHMIEEAAYSERIPHEVCMEQDLAILLHCGTLFVLVMNGTTQSRGVQEEIAFAAKHNIDVRYIFYNPSTGGFSFANRPLE